MNAPPAALVVMGVAGCGKSMLGLALAQRLGWAFKDGDDLHPPANMAKMSAGQPLDDADRAPWLDAVAAWIDAHPQGGVATCSALKRAYRDRLAAGRPALRFVYIALDREAAARRIAARRGHFFPASLLASQFADLEPPAPDEAVVEVDGTLPVDALADAALAGLGLAR